MEISILESYNDHNYSLVVTSFVKRAFCDFVSEFGCDETHRAKSHVGSKICICINGHSEDNNPDVFIRPKGILLKSKPIVEYYVSLPTNKIKNSKCRIETWTLFMLCALELVEEKSGVKFGVLRRKNQSIELLANIFKSDDIFKFDSSAHDPDSPSVIVL